MENLIVYRKNFNGKIVKCGFLFIEEKEVKLNLERKIGIKYNIFNFKMNTNAKNIEDLNHLIHFNDNLWLLNNFDRNLRIKKMKSSKNQMKTVVEKDKKKKKLLSFKKQERERVLKLRIDMKEKKREILDNHKSNKLKIDIFENEDTLGTLGDFFSSNIEVNVIQSDKKTIDSSKTVNLKKEIIKRKLDKSTNTGILALWDIENVHFYNDFSLINKLIPKDSIKIFSYAKKNHKNKIYLKGNKLDFVLNKLRKRGWITKRTTKIADKELIDEFNSRADKIKELYLITADKDYKEICDKAIELGINVHVINNEGRNRYSWFNKDIYDYTYIGKINDY